MLHTFIFDLDGTTIDSSHRLGDGSLDDWRRLNTAQNIALDSTLPLADRMREAIAQNCWDIVILTSRVMGRADYDFLAANDLVAPVILSRSPADDRPAGQYKLARLHELAIDRRVSWDSLRRSVIIWDDDPDVKQTLQGAGIRVCDPVRYNNYFRGAA